MFSARASGAYASYAESTYLADLLGAAARRRKGGRIDAVVCMAETLRHRVGGHGASLDEEDGAGGKNG